MKIKKVITAGCSFSDPHTHFTWPNQLEKYVGDIDPAVEFEHMGMPSQGQELIQKKVSLALIESLEKYQPDEIAIVVMWSGTERKSFYIDNKDEIKRISSTWIPNSIWWATQFADLKNTVSKPKIMQTTRHPIEYNEDPGWYICAFGVDDASISEAYYKISSTNMNAIHTSVENMVVLQNLCKIKGVSIYQQYYMDYVYEDIENNSDHQLINYLYKQLDHSTIVTTTGMYEYVKTNDHRYLLSAQDVHPNEDGHAKWLKEKLIPFLDKKGFFNG